MGHDLTPLGGAKDRERLPREVSSDGAPGPRPTPEARSRNPTRAAGRCAEKRARPLGAAVCAVLLGCFYLWGASTLPWHHAPSCAWAGSILGGTHIWVAWALWAVKGPQALRAATWVCLGCWATLLLGLAQGVSYLTGHFGALGRGLSAGALVILLPLAALGLPAAFWVRDQLRLTHNLPPPPAPTQRPGPPSSPRRLARRWLVSLVALGAPALVAWPATWANEDSFPLSSYPMFAHPRPIARLVRLEGEKPDGTRSRIPIQALFPGEPLQARVLLALLAHDQSAQQWCETLRHRFAAGTPALHSLQTVRLQRHVVAPLEYFEKGPHAGRIEPLGRCSLAPSPSDTAELL